MNEKNVSEKREKVSIFVDSLHRLEDEEELIKLLRIGEGKYVEFKTRLPTANIIAKTISAFANTEGGITLFGVDDLGNVVGMKQNEKKIFESTMTETLMTINPAPQSISWGIVSFKGKGIGAVLVFYDGYRPFYVAKNVFKRVGAATVKIENVDLNYFSQDASIFESLRFETSVIRTFLSIADEDAFTEVLLVPFLRHLGFRSVLSKGHEDKSLEFGQDIRSFKFQLPTGHWLYFAAQVKTKDLIYSPKTGEGLANIERVLTQANMAFGHEMFDVETNTMNLPDHLLLVTTKEINEGARIFLSESLKREKRRRILMWEGDYIYERIVKEGLPMACQIELETYVSQKMGT